MMCGNVLTWRIFFSLVCGFARWFLLSSFLSFIVRVLCRQDQVANGFSFICIQLDHSSAATVNFIFSLPLSLSFLSPHVFFFSAPLSFSDTHFSNNVVLCLCKLIPSSCFLLLAVSLFLVIFFFFFSIFFIDAFFSPSNLHVADSSSL